MMGIATAVVWAVLQTPVPAQEKGTPEVEKYDLAKTGIERSKGLDCVLNRGKAILLFQLLGNFDDVYC